MLGGLKCLSEIMVLILVSNGKGQREAIKHVVHVTLWQAERWFCILSGQEALTAYFKKDSVMCFPNEHFGECDAIIIPLKQASVLSIV